MAISKFVAEIDFELGKTKNPQNWPHFWWKFELLVLV
jgi:hypothetical protein